MKDERERGSRIVGITTILQEFGINMVMLQLLLSWVT